MAGETLTKRLKRLRDKHRLTQTEMATLFGIGLGMYQKLEYGTYAPGPSTMKRYMEDLQKFEREKDLRKYLSGVHVNENPPENQPAEGEVEGVDYFIQYNRILLQDNEALRKSAVTQTNHINFLYEENRQLKARISELERQYLHR